MKSSGKTTGKLLTLLVPTDFSAAAKNAARYSVHLAAEIKAKVILLSVIEMDTSEVVLSNWRKLEIQLKQSAGRDLEKLRTELKKEVPSADVTLDITQGIPMSDAIATYADENKVNLIVMGTKGASGLKKILQGSNTAELMQVSTVPVIGVPAKAVYSKLKNIVYATDLKNVKQETKRLARFAELFKANIMALHCVPEGPGKRLNKNLEPELIKAAEYAHITFHQVQGDAVENAIGQFIKKTNADLLVMFTHERTFFQKIMGESVTRAMAFESRVPLMAFNRPTP